MRISVDLRGLFSCSSSKKGRVRGRRKDFQSVVVSANGPLDAEFLHAATERVGVEIQNLCSSSAAFDYPLCSIENLEDMATFDFFECGGRSSNRAVPCGIGHDDFTRCRQRPSGCNGGCGCRLTGAERWKKIAFQSQDRSWREHDRSLDNVLQLSNVAGPRVVHQETHGFLGNAINLPGTLSAVA